MEFWLFPSRPNNMVNPNGNSNSSKTLAGPITKEESVPSICAGIPTYAVCAEANIQRSHVITSPGTDLTITLPLPLLHQTLLSANPTPDLPNKIPVTPIIIGKLSPFLMGHPDANYLINGLQAGFTLGFIGLRSSSSCSNFKSCVDMPHIVLEKLHAELKAKRIQGPFDIPPFPYMKISPIGLVPKKAPGQYRLIHHLSNPKGQSVNDFIDQLFSSVNYSSFDDAVSHLVSLGPGTFMAKTDIDSAFRIIPIHPLDHELLGFTFLDKYYFDTCLPMGASSSCAILERFSTAIHWIAFTHLKVQHMVHILDDFLILGTQNSCHRNLTDFLQFCSKIGIPIKWKKQFIQAKL